MEIIPAALVDCAEIRTLDANLFIQKDAFSLPSANIFKIREQNI